MRPRPAFYRTARFLAHVVGRALWGVRVAGREHVPATGALLVAVSHESVLDPVVVGAEFPRTLRFLARNTLFGPRGEVRWYGRAIGALGAVPIERDGGGARDTLRLALELLRQGDAVLIFPEGTRSPDGRLQEFRKGVALIARAAGCPVLPVGLRGTRDLWRKGAKLPRLFGGPVQVHIGAPVTYGDDTRPDDVLADLRERIVALRGADEAPPGADGERKNEDG